jgi:hypothetical protein
MKIQINEVWNKEGKSVELAVIEPIENPGMAVHYWIRANRPDLHLAGLNDHGFHAIQI